MPLLVVVGAWIVMSFGTTMYLRWIEREYDRVFSENLSSLRAITELESAVWMTIGEWTDPSLDADQMAAHQKEHETKLFQLFDKVRQSAHTAEERMQEDKLHDSLREICSAMDTEVNIGRTTRERSAEAMQRLWGHAARFAADAATVRTINDGLISESLGRLADAQSFVTVTRIMMMMFGPILGLYLGWRFAHQLQSSVSRIAVTLSDPDMLFDSSEMTVSITPGSTFESVQRQAERVVERLKSVGEELKSARREVIQSERLAAVGELAAGVAHELRNPLTSVKLLLQYASRQPDSFRIDQSRLQLILDEISRMETTIQGLLDFSRRPSLHPVHHDLRSTLTRSLNLVDGRLKQAGIESLTDISPDPLWIDGDAEQLSQVFVNLLLNAIEAMPQGGRLHVSAQRGTSTCAHVVVSDSGDGIAAKMMPRLFEPFSTTKERGTGLGLAISHRIVSDHHGTIRAVNQPGSGAIFTVELPLSLKGSEDGKTAGH